MGGGQVQCPDGWLSNIEAVQKFDVLNLKHRRHVSLLDMHDILYLGSLHALSTVKGMSERHVIEAVQKFDVLNLKQRRHASLLDMHDIYLGSLHALVNREGHVREARN